jgi:hypothetical protein
MKSKFKVGDHVEVIYPGRPATGKTGIITRIDSLGQKYVTYDDGQSYGRNKWGDDDSLKLILEPHQAEYEKRVKYWTKVLS